MARIATPFSFKIQHPIDAASVWMLKSKKRATSTVVLLQGLQKGRKKSAAGRRQRVATTAGPLDVGQLSTDVAVSCPHCDEAFAACRHAINRLTELVPSQRKQLSNIAADMWRIEH